MGRKISDEGGYCSVSVRTGALNRKGNGGSRLGLFWFVYIVVTCRETRVVPCLLDCSYSPC